MFAREARSDTARMRSDCFREGILSVEHSQGGGGSDEEKNGAVVIALATVSVVQAATTMHGSTISTLTDYA